MEAHNIMALLKDFILGIEKEQNHSDRQLARPLDKRAG